MKKYNADVVVIGAGASGATIARELSRYKVETMIVEKGGLISAGPTSASMAGVYAGGLNILTSLLVKKMYQPDVPLHDPNSRKGRWVEEGFKMWPQLFKDLEIKHTYGLSMAVALDKKQLADLENLMEIGGSLGGVYANIRWADRETVFNLEPYISRDVLGAVYSENLCIWMRPWEIPIAMTDNAKQNGVKVLLDAEVTGISRRGDCQVVETGQGEIRTRFIVNAAGVFADVVADMGGGGRDWDLFLPRSCLMVLDSHARRYLHNHVILPPAPGILEQVIPTVDGNILLNIGRYVSARDKYDLACHRDEYIEALEKAHRIFPPLSAKDVIRDFVGMRAWNTREPEENIVEPLPGNPRMINVAIRPPGLTPAPAIAKDVVAMLADAGLELVTNPGFTPYRKAIPSFHDLDNDERNKLIAADPCYGHVVCRCETVTEGEIVEAIRRGARTVAEVKYRTRGGMGRCQGGFCGPRIVAILARELNIPPTEVTYKGAGSPIIPYRTKELLEMTAV